MSDSNPVGDFERVDALLAADDYDALDALLAEDPSFAHTRGPKDQSILLQALYRGRRRAAHRLAEAKQTVDVFEMVGLGLVDGVRGMLEISPQVPTAIAPDGFPLLHLACYLSQPEIAELLLEHGADPESRSTNGAELAALHAAVAGGDLACVELLLARDVDVNALQQGGITALHAAAHHGRPDMVRALLRAGADPALTCEAGRDARSWGAEHPKVLALLV